jgi:predicted transposase YdaD
MSNSVIQPTTTLHEAWEQGLQQGVIQVALNMVRDGLDLAQVAKLTGLPIESVKKLQVVNDPEDSQALVQEFLSLSESSLNKIWLTPEEDEAWKDL